MSRVGLRKCETYSKTENRLALLELLQGFDKEKLKDASVLVIFDFPSPDISLLEVLFQFLKEAGTRKISIGTTLFAEKLPENLEKLIKTEGIEFVDFKDKPYEKMDMPFRKEKMKEHYRGFAILSPGQYAQEKAMDKMDAMKTRVLKNAYIPVSIMDSDYILPVIKMKDSPINKIGGFANLMLKVVPTLTRTEMMLKLIEGKFYESIIETLGLIKDKVVFGLIDGVDAEISNNRELNKMNVLLFSEDLLSLDAVMSVLMGFNSAEIDTNRIGDLYGVGNGILSHITLFGDNFLDFKKDYVKKLRYSNAFGRRKQVPTIESKDDAAIEAISFYCPTGAIEQSKDSSFSIDKQKCIFCNFCIEISDNRIKL